MQYSGFRAIILKPATFTLSQIFAQNVQDFAFSRGLRDLQSPEKQI
jgi:hypothetical protein